MTEFPGNSRYEKESEITEETPPIDETEGPRTRRIVTGEVIRTKKGVGSKLVELAGGVFGGLVQDVLVPALKDLARDFVYQGIDRALYRGDDRPTSRPGSAYPSRVQSTVHTPYNQVSRRQNNQPRQGSRRSAPEPINLDDIVLKTSVEAEDIKQEMAHVIERYGVCTVADLNHMLGLTSTYPDNNWGWFDLTGTRVRRERNGYRLILPTVEDVQ